MVFFKTDGPIKVLCLAGALVLQFYVRKGEDVIRRTITIPVPPITVPSGLRVVEPPVGSNVQVDLDGPGRILRVLKDEDVKLDFDPSNVKPGRRVLVPVSVTLPDTLTRQDRSRVSVDWRPKSIPVQIVSDATKQFEVVLKPVNRPEGWRMKEYPHPNPTTVTVSGTQDAVNQVASVVAEFPVEQTQEINTLVTLRAIDADGKPVERLLLEPPQVLVKGLQESVVLHKKVPVQPIFQVPAGEHVKVDVSPSSVRITGPSRQVGDILVLETEPVQLPVGQTSVSEEVSLREPPEGVQVVPLKVRVTIRLLPGAAKPEVKAPG